MSYLDKSGLSRLWGHVVTHVNDKFEPAAEHIERQDNPHNVTAEQAGAAPAEHFHNQYASLTDFGLIKGDIITLKTSTETKFAHIIQVNGSFTMNQYFGYWIHYNGEIGYIGANSSNMLVTYIDEDRVMPKTWEIPEGAEIQIFQRQVKPSDVGAVAEGQVLTFQSIFATTQTPKESKYVKLNRINGLTEKSKNLITNFTVDYTSGLYTCFAGQNCIKINGNATTTGDKNVFAPYQSFYLKANTTYTFINTVIGTLPGAVTLHIIEKAPTNGQVITTCRTGYRKTFTTPDHDCTCYIGITTDTLGEYNNIIINPDIKEGEINPSYYYPHYDELHSAIVTTIGSTYGNNILPFPYVTSGEVDYDGVKFTVKDSGEVSVSVDFTLGNDFIVLLDKTSEYYNGFFTPGCSYMLLGENSSLSVVVSYKDQNGATKYFKSKGTNCFTWDANWILDKIYVSTNKVGGNYSTSVTPQIYRANLIDIPVDKLPNYGISINDNLYNYIDFKNKQYVQNVGCVDLGTLDWIYSSDYNVFTTQIADIKAATPNLLSAMYYTSPEDSATACPNMSIYGRGPTSVYTQSGIGVKNNDYTDAASFKAAMSGVMVIYELANPIIIDISNIISNDILPVEAKGYVSLANKYGIKIRAILDYYNNGNDIVIANTFFGDVVGTADKAISNEKGLKLANNATKKTNSDVAYVKDVPENSAGYAKIGKIGGKTRKCTNLLVNNVTTNTRNGVTFTVNSDKSITLRGTATVTTYFFISEMSLKAGSYTLSGVTAGSDYWGALYDDQSYVASSNATHPVQSFTITENKTCRFYISVESGKTLNTTVYPMLNEGTEALPYEPYFEGLRSAPVTAVDSVGTNMLKWLGLKPGSITRNGITMTVNDDYTFTFNGTATGNMWPSFLENEWPNTNWKGYNNAIPVQKGVYTFSVKEISGSRTASNDIVIAYYVDHYDDAYTLSSSSKNSVFTTDRINSIYIGFASGDVYNNYTFAVQLQRGDVATEIVEPTVNTLPIPSAVHALDSYGCSIDDTLYNYIDFEKKQYVQNVRKVVLDGSESWLVYNSNMNTYYFDAIAKTYSPMLHTCEYEFKMSAGAAAAYALTYGAFTVEEWKAYLVENPMTVIYQLATPEVIDISHLLPSDSIPVEAGGTIIMVNAYGYDVPNTVEFYEGANEIVGADTFVGDLVGTAGRAIADENGNNIAEAYQSIALKQAAVISAHGDLETFLDNLYTSLPNRTLKTIMVSNNADSSGSGGLSGGNWVITLFKSTNDYGYIHATSYGFAGAPRSAKRNKYNGYWNNWVHEKPYNYVLSTDDITAGTTSLANGQLYYVYE